MVARRPAALAVLLSLLLLASALQRLDETRNPCFREEDGEEYCVPHTYIVGMRKSGTSALWLKLGNNTQLDLRPRKEYCPTDLAAEGLAKWASLFPRPYELQGDRLVVSGCIGLSDQMGQQCVGCLRQRVLLRVKAWGSRRYFRMLQQRNVSDFRVLLMLRDFPAWLYARYAYWCSPEFGDAECVQPGSHRGPENHRSAAHFTQLLTSAGSAEALAYQSWRAVIERLVDVVGRQRLLVLAQHDLYSEAGAVMRRVEAFMGVPNYTYPSELLQGVVNHSNNKGVRATSHKLQPGQYQDIGDMEPAARTLLEAQWRSDCVWLQNEWGLCFASCCDVSSSRRRRVRLKQQ